MGNQGGKALKWLPAHFNFCGSMSTRSVSYTHLDVYKRQGLYHVLLLICNRELLFIGKREDEDDMAKSTKTYEERIRALEKKERRFYYAVLVWR